MKSTVTCALFLFLFSYESSLAQILVEAEPIDAHTHIQNGSTYLAGPSVLSLPGYFVWGGSVIKGEDGKYHMFFSRWKSGEDAPPFNTGWLTHSEIAYAVSDDPDKNFQFVKVVIRGRKHTGDSSTWDGQSVHNPHIRSFNGNYFLYYTGTTDPGKPSEGAPGSSLSRRDRIQQSQQIGVLEFKSIQDLVKGIFKRYDTPLLSPRTRVKPDKALNPSAEGTTPLPDNIIVVNPSVVYHKQKKQYLLYFKGNLYNPNWRGVHGVAVSDTPYGPFKALNHFVFEIKMEDGRLASAEDPYVWVHPGNQLFYAVFKDFSGKITGNDPGLAIMYSEDGMTWSKTEQPLFMKKELKLKNAGILKIDRLERPQLLINDQGMPIVLYSACAVESVNQKKDGSSCNVQIRLIEKEK